MFKSTGILKYFKGNKLIVEVDQAIADYYRSLIPKYIPIEPQMYSAHISVVRKEIPLKLEYWNKYENEVVEFNYDGIIHHGKVYYWLNVFSVRLEEIRRELGLSVISEYTIPPEGFNKVFHITVGNCKHIK